MGTHGLKVGGACGEVGGVCVNFFVTSVSYFILESWVSSLVVR